MLNGRQDNATWDFAVSTSGWNAHTTYPVVRCGPMDVKTPETMPILNMVSWLTFPARPCTLGTAAFNCNPKNTAFTNLSNASIQQPLLCLKNNRNTKKVCKRYCKYHVIMVHTPQRASTTYKSYISHSSWHSYPGGFIPNNCFLTHLDKIARFRARNCGFWSNKPTVYTKQIVTRPFV